MKELLSDEIYNIYTSMRPLFEKTALKFRIPNPEYFVDAWMSKAYLVANSLDNARVGALQVSELRDFRGYLFTAFKNDLIKIWGLKSKISTEEDMAEVADLNAMPETEGYRISDVRSVIAFHIMERNKHLLQMSRSEYIDHAFQYSMYLGLRHLEQKFDNCLLCDIDNKDWTLSSTPQINDLLHELNLATAYCLGHLAKNEFCPSTQGDMLDRIIDGGVAKAIAGFFSHPVHGIAANIEVGMDGEAVFEQTKVLKIVPDQKLKLAKKYMPSALNYRGTALADDADVKIREIFASIIKVNETLLDKRLAELKGRMT